MATRATYQSITQYEYQNAFPFEHAREIFEIEYNCECAERYTDLECLIADIDPNSVAVYKDVDVRSMYRTFFSRKSYTMQNDRMNIHGVFVWDETGKIDKVASHSATIKRVFKNYHGG